ncbi:MAG: peptidylprolyl isomerase [Pseudomonadales bacterium]|nr:peptidylprolyl isomerase [Pseudomonadales bacterium]NIX08197.1 peptidylprolyl isomerase [Pseudomonadales bacterium]
MKIADQCVVAFHYTLTGEDGRTLDSSSGGEPLSYLHGNQGLIPGLERELTGREAGDELNVVVQPEDGYGVPDPALVQEVPLEVLAQIEDLQVGMQLQSQASDGSIQVFVVEAISEETATLNANHALAGHVLIFDVSIVDVRSATPEEIDHGHPNSI